MEASDTVYCYDIKTAKMVEVANMPRPSYGHGCVSIHRFGGTNISTENAAVNPKTGRSMDF